MAITDVECEREERVDPFIYVTAENQGTDTVTFNVTVYANTTEIGKQAVTLESWTSTTIAFTWNTHGWPPGNYTISAVADTIPGEIDIADNIFIDGWVIIEGLLIEGPYYTWTEIEYWIVTHDERPIRLISNYSYP